MLERRHLHQNNCHLKTYSKMYLKLEVRIFKKICLRLQGPIRRSGRKICLLKKIRFHSPHFLCKILNSYMKPLERYSEVSKIAQC